MGEKRRKWFREVIKPSRLKVIVFIILIMVIFLVPTYPTATEEHRDLNGAFQIVNKTTLQPLAKVLYFNFEWIETIRFGGMAPAMVGIWLGSTYYHQADPIFLTLYIPLFILLYIGGCFIAEYMKYNRKTRKGIKDL